MEASQKSHSSLLLSHWKSFSQKIKAATKDIKIDGQSLDLAAVIAVARHGAQPTVNEASMQATAKSAKALDDSLAKGQVVYGVNTGYGGSANTRTQGVIALQHSLLRGLHYGILPQWTNTQSESRSEAFTSPVTQNALSLDDPIATTSMPESWVRAAMLIRLNSLATGYSGVKPTTIETLAQLLEKDIVPRIPLRGSISASGDLSPLSYIGGLMQGKPSISAWTGNRSLGQRRIERGDLALAEYSIPPIKIGPKEGLAIVNGTAISTGVGALALHEAHCQAVLAQILTAMTVESLSGTDESFDPFFAKVRPHPGQADSASSIYAFLNKSELVCRTDGSEASSLRQDRYSIRTASQWIGPVLEDFLLAHQQVMIEVNSVTDNPLLDTSSERMLHGGNFQAKAITSAMEKVRQGCQSIGRMLFVQCSELINPATNRGLPPNLVINEPSESFIWKGTDIMIAALQSELGFLANPVGTHVQTAEMGNQALNSLALISARYTLDALQVLTQLSAAHLNALCQALDLRALNLIFLESLNPHLQKMVQSSFGNVIADRSERNALAALIWTNLSKLLEETAGLDSSVRFTTVAQSLQPFILKSAPKTPVTLQALDTFTERFSTIALEIFESSRDSYLLNPDATPYLGVASSRMYRFVRQDLKVPFLQEANITTPNNEPADNDSSDIHVNRIGGKTVPTVGDFITRIYESMRSGKLYAVVVECLEEVK